MRSVELGTEHQKRDSASVTCCRTTPPTPPMCRCPARRRRPSPGPRAASAPRCMGPRAAAATAFCTKSQGPMSSGCHTRWASARSLPWSCVGWCFRDQAVCVWLSAAASAGCSAVRRAAAPGTAPRPAAAQADARAGQPHHWCAAAMAHSAVCLCWSNLTRALQLQLNKLVLQHGLPSVEVVVVSPAQAHAPTTWRMTRSWQLHCRRPSAGGGLTTAALQPPHPPPRPSCCNAPAPSPCSRRRHAGLRRRLKEPQPARRRCRCGRAPGCDPARVVLCFC
jgi:hypothetical protein